MKCFHCSNFFSNPFFLSTLKKAILREREGEKEIFLLLHPVIDNMLRVRHNTLAPRCIKKRHLKFSILFFS